MKLSMWMIANRLLSFDMEINIKEEAPVHLRSARRAYATNCVHVFQAGNDVICNGEGDYIRIKDMKAGQGFEIVQGIFDFYDDWYSGVMEAVLKKDYLLLVDLCWKVFHNPLLLLDGNCKVLAMCSHYGEDDLDEEWQYLCRYGYCSLKAINHIKHDYKYHNFNKPDIQRYHFQEEVLQMGGMSCGLYFQETLCGRMNLLESERILNHGDYQLLELISKVLIPSLGIQDVEKTANVHNNVFNNLLEGKKVEEEELGIQLSYEQWDREEIYQIYLLEVSHGNINEAVFQTLGHTVVNLLPKCKVLTVFPHVVIISNESKDSGEDKLHMLAALRKRNTLKISSSLPIGGINHISFLLEQAKAAFSYGAMYHPELNCYNFYDYGVDYIVESKSLIHSIHACHPDVLMLWNRKVKAGDDMLHTFHCYLNYERSILSTAQALFVHRNTLIYRIKKLHNMLHYDLNDIYTRDYMKLSIKVLGLYEHKGGR